jgi:hypothetical protein
MQDNWLGRVVVAVLVLVILVFIGGAVSPYDFRGPNRLRLRTVLIAVALVAVVVGLAIYSLMK